MRVCLCLCWVMRGWVEGAGGVIHIQCFLCLAVCLLCVFLFVHLPRQAVNCFGHYCVCLCLCLCLCVCVCTYIYTRNSLTDTCKLSTTDFEVCMDVLIRMGLGRRMLGCLVFASLLACLVLAALLSPPRFSGARFLSSSLAMSCARPSASRVVVLGSCSRPRVVLSSSGRAPVLGWSLAALVLPSCLVRCSVGTMCVVQPFVHRDSMRIKFLLNGQHYT
jgi:hypothetical protein